MNISTGNLNINDIKGAEKYGIMDKESLHSYIGRVILELELQKDHIQIKEALTSVIYEILKRKACLKEDNILSISKNLAGGIVDELEKYVSVTNLKKEEVEFVIEPFIDKMAFLMDEDLKTVCDSSSYQKLLSIGLVNDVIIEEELTISRRKDAMKELEVLPENILIILKNIKNNISNKGKTFLKKMESIPQLDFWTKATLGFMADFLGGNLLSKLIYLDVNDNEIMLDKIKREGIVHFTSSYNADKILNGNNNYIKASNLILSGGKKRTYFFAGIPSFKDITINIYSYNVMYGIRIYPDSNQLNQLIYREYNDKAIAYNGNFHFKSDQVKKVYYGLKMNEEKELFYEEITEEEAKNYQISDELKQLYNGDGSFKHKLLCNAYSFYYELENYIKLLKRIKKYDFQTEPIKEESHVR